MSGTRAANSAVEGHTCRWMGSTTVHAHQGRVLR